MEAVNTVTGSEAARQQQQQPQQQSDPESQQQQQHEPEQQKQRDTKEETHPQDAEGDTQEVIREWLLLRQSATLPRVLAAIDKELRGLGCDVSALAAHHPTQQQHKAQDEEHVQQQDGQHLKAKEMSPAQSPTPGNAGLQPIYQQPIKLSSGPAAVAGGPSAPFLPLTSFAWDQTADAIKLYVKVPGVQNLPQENIRMHAAPRSIELEFVGVENKNFSFAQKTLSNPINPNSCSYRVKRDMVVVTLRKASPTWWAELSQKRETKLSTPKFNENADPGVSIMAMMKNLYEEGDDEMKRMIAKSWRVFPKKFIKSKENSTADVLCSIY